MKWFALIMFVLLPVLFGFDSVKLQKPDKKVNISPKKPKIHQILRELQKPPIPKEVINVEKKVEIAFSWQIVTKTKKNSVKTQIAYLESIAKDAVKNQIDSRVPASITMAQALLESGAGKSSLTKKAKNHFGIKKGGGWKGEVVWAKDFGDGWGWFRRYESDSASFADHASFLIKNKRYKDLFALDIESYHDWAWGLQYCGYATSDEYAAKLIFIIKRYNLDKYDRYGEQQRNELLHKVGPANIQVDSTESYT